MLCARLVLNSLPCPCLWRNNKNWIVRRHFVRVIFVKINLGRQAICGRDMHLIIANNKLIVYHQWRKQNGFWEGVLVPKRPYYLAAPLIGLFIKTNSNSRSLLPLRFSDFLVESKYNKNIKTRWRIKILSTVSINVSVSVTGMWILYYIEYWIIY